VGVLVVGGIGIAVEEAVGAPALIIPFLLLGIYGAFFVVTYCNVGLAAAANLSMDGRDTKLRDGFAVARERRGVIAQWALLELGLGLLVSLIGSLLGGGRGGGVGTSILNVLAGAAWAVASFFVIPLMALEGIGPRAAVKRSVELVKKHWGEGIAGRTGIGLTVFLVAAVPFFGLCFGADALNKTSPVWGGVVSGLAVLVGLAAYALGMALSVIFRMELYRYATKGALSGGLAEPDFEGALR
jgi:hypothetical protein